MKDDPTARHARFVREYLVDFNATQAAIRTRYSPRTAKQQRSRLLTKPSVAAAVRRGTDARAAKVEASDDRVLAAIAFSDVRAYLPLRDGGGAALGALTPA